MKHTFETAEIAETVKRRAFILAYRASIPMGLGYLHARPDSKEDEAKLTETLLPTPGETLVTDYVAGRMMKLRIRHPEPTVLETRDDAPRADYQSWATSYPTYEALIEAARKED